MKLGNSAGNNKGKKYIIRGKHDNNPCAGGVEKSEAFNTWFANNYQSLVAEQVARDTLDDDVMNETYVRMYEGILYGNMNVIDYRSYFSRAYFTNCIQRKVQESRFNILDKKYDITDDDVYDPTLEHRQKMLELDIFNYVYHKYEIREFELFKMYFSLKPAVNYRILSDITKLKVHQIQSTLAKIKKDVCRQPHFVARRRELIA